MFKQQRAFTLIELMVVMAIMTVIFALVGPLAQNQVDKVKASEEWYSFSELVRSVPTHSFVSGSRLSLVIEKNSASLFRRGELIKSVDYDHLFFPAQTVIFSSNGYTTSTEIYVKVRGFDRVLNLNLEYSQRSGDLK